MVVSSVEVSNFFLQNWNLWTNAEDIHYGIIANGLLTRVGSHAGLTRVGSGTY